MTWTEVQLGDAIHVKHGFAFKGQFFKRSGRHVVLTPGNFNEGGGFRLRPGKDRFYSGDIPEEYILKKDDLIVAMTEQGPGLLGSSALIPESGRYLHNQRLGLVQIRDDTVFDTRFFYYLFNTKPVREQINGSATGTKVRHTAPECIYRVIASVPSSVEEQRSIARVLCSYDSLIENNRQRIQLLEQAARLLYKEWFIHLRFPGYQHTTIIDDVPKGWARKPLSKLCKVVRESVDPKMLPPDTAYIGLEHIPRRSITLRDWTHSAEVESTKFKFTRDDILFGKIRPYFHKVGFTLINGITSSDAIVIRPVRNDIYEYLLLLLSSDLFVSIASQTVREGSKMP